MLRAVLLFFAMLFFAGCASRVPTNTIRASLSSGETAALGDLREKMEEAHESFGEFVTALNVAHLLQMEGKWKDSIQQYNGALAILEEYEARAQINVREMAAKAGTFLLARGAMEYYGTGYERSLLHTFNSLNYMMLGEFTDAAVEMRKMGKRQEYWLQESRARIEKNLESHKTTDLPSRYSMREMLEDESIRRMINNYQDSFSYALGSIVFRIAGDMQASDVSMRRAVALDGRAEALFRRAWQPSGGKEKMVKKKGKKAEDTEEGDSITIPRLEPPRVNAITTDTLPQEVSPVQTPSSQEVTIIALSGISPSLKVEHVPMVFPRVGYVMLDLPSYTKAIPGLKPHASVSPESPFTFYPLLRIDKLAYRTLQDEMDFELTSAISRAVVRASVSQSAQTRSGSRSRSRSRSRSGNEGYRPVVTIGTLLLGLLSYSMADSVRNWETLPNEGYIAMTTVPGGSTITIGGGTNQESLTLPNDIRGVIILAYYSNSRMNMSYVTY